MIVAGLKAVLALFFSPKAKTLQQELEAIRNKNKSVWDILVNLELNKQILTQERIQDAFRKRD